LVERVPREAGRAARLRVTNRPFRVGGRGRGEDETADDEDDRRQPEGDAGGQPERVVDRRADVPVRGREEGGRAEDTLESWCLTPAAGHRRTLVLSRDAACPHGEAAAASSSRRCRAPLPKCDNLSHYHETVTSPPGAPLAER